MHFPQGGPEQASRAGGDRLVRVGVIKGDEEEGAIVFPWYSTEAGEVYFCKEVLVSVVFVADLKLAEVGQIVHVPAKDNTAEAKTIFGDGEELLLGDELAT